jgi:hypothetical protein
LSISSSSIEGGVIAAFDGLILSIGAFTGSALVQQGLFSFGEQSR